MFGKTATLWFFYLQWLTSEPVKGAAEAVRLPPRKETKEEYKALYLFLVAIVAHFFADTVWEAIRISLAACMEAGLVRLRAEANAALAQYEPLALVVAPIVTLFLARALHVTLRALREKGIKGAVLGFIITFVK